VHSTLVIMRLTLREAYRRWIVWVALLLGLAFLAVFGIGFNEIQKDIARTMTRGLFEYNEVYNFLSLAGLYAVNFLCAMMAVLTSVDTLAGEIASGTVHTLVSKPLRRWEIVMGKWLGFSAMLLLYLLLMGGGVLLLVYLLSGYAPPHPFVGLGLMALNAVLLLSVSLMGGANLSTLANGVLVFGLFGVAFIGGWIEQFGALLDNPTAINIGIFSSLILPSEALWKRAAFEMQSPLAATIGFSPFTSSSVPSPLMMIYAVVYSAAALLAAARNFGRRDL
jgi:Cu-processing system permease protein